MREIKFRVWNDIDKVMIEWSTLRASPSLPGMLMAGKVKHHSLMQFTGLIYCNGEILSAGDHVGDWQRLYVGDKFEVSGIGVCSIVICPFYGVCFDDGGNCGTIPVIDCIAENDDIKLIGNIHENKEGV